MRAHELLTSTPAGLYCEAGGFHIDPPVPVARALITHAHSDHARPGHGAVLATQETLDIINAQYTAGTTDYLQVIVAQTASLNTQRTAIDILARRLTASVLLIEALGGGWDSP